MSRGTSPVRHARRAHAVRTLLAAAAVGAGGCGDAAPAPTDGALITATVRNALDVDVTVSAGSALVGIIPGGASTAVAFPPGTTQVAWRSRKRQFSNGAPIPDDLEGGVAPLAADGGAVEVTNVVQGVAYVTPVVASPFADTLAIEVAQGETRRCIGLQFGASAEGLAWGYYRHDASMAMRVYRGTRCQGSALTWTAAQLGAFAPRTGRVVLLVDRLP